MATSEQPEVPALQINGLSKVESQSQSRSQPLTRAFTAPAPSQANPLTIQPVPQAAASTTDLTLPEVIDYVNPLESSSRWYLSARANTIRYAASLGFSIANRTDPSAPEPTREVWLDSMLSRFKGKKKIKVEVWVPPRLSAGPRPAVIVFHGGGWILGQGTDNARWAGAAMGSLDAVVFTVNYRLSPNYPFPTPLEDCVDSILQIASRAEEFGIDPTKIMTSGFSAGATSTLSSWIILNDPERFGYNFNLPVPRIAGMAVFYPVLDWTVSRPEKRLASKRPDMTLTKSMTDLIDASYVYPALPRSECTDPRLSPGLMSDELLMKLPPMHLCLCEYDMLLAEGLNFSKRLEDRDKHHSLRIVKGERHAWDNPLPMTPKESVYIEYGEATQAMATWLGKECESDSASMKSMKRKRPLLKRPSYLSFRSRSTRQ